MRVLIVEDNGDYRRFLCAYVKDILPEAEVREAGDGLFGYDVYEEFAPTFIITDLQMPRLNGEEMVKKIRKKDAEVPIALASGAIHQVRDPKLFTQIFGKCDIEGIREFIAEQAKAP